MGRKKIPIARISKESTRRITFSKRRDGFFKKAIELSILCDVEYAIVCFDEDGETLFECSSSNVENILRKRGQFVQEHSEDPRKHEAYSNNDLHLFETGLVTDVRRTRRDTYKASVASYEAPPPSENPSAETFIINSDRISPDRTAPIKSETQSPGFSRYSRFAKPKDEENSYGSTSSGRLSASASNSSSLLRKRRRTSMCVDIPFKPRMEPQPSYDQGMSPVSSLGAEIPRLDRDSSATIVRPKSSSVVSVTPITATFDSNVESFSQRISNPRQPMSGRLLSPIAGHPSSTTSYMLSSPSPTSEIVDFTQWQMPGMLLTARDGHGSFLQGHTGNIVQLQQIQGLYPNTTHPALQVSASDMAHLQQNMMNEEPSQSSSIHSA
eukprot:61445_1